MSDRIESRLKEDRRFPPSQSFCDRAGRGQFPKLNDRDDLWRLLVVITVRKVQDQLERARAAKRGGGRVVVESALAGLFQQMPLLTL